MQKSKWEFRIFSVDHRATLFLRSIPFCSASLSQLLCTCMWKGRWQSELWIRYLRARTGLQSRIPPQHAVLCKSKVNFSRSLPPMLQSEFVLLPPEMTNQCARDDTVRWTERLYHCPTLRHLFRDFGAPTALFESNLTALTPGCESETGNFAQPFPLKQDLSLGHASLTSCGAVVAQTPRFFKDTIVPHDEQKTRFRRTPTTSNCDYKQTAPHIESCTF
jgi:hypothetical protein